MFLYYDIFVFVLLTALSIAGFIIFIFNFFRIFNNSKERTIKQKRIILICTLTIFICVFTSVTGWFIAIQESKIFLNTLWSENKLNTKIIIQNIASEINHIYNAVNNLSSSYFIETFLNNPDKKNYELINSDLDRYKNSFDLSVCYVLNNSGRVVATSNRNDSDSFLGKIYNFRSYFMDAMKGRTAKSIAQGVTSNKWGIYISCPIKNSKDEIIGVVVFKKNLTEFNKLLSSYNRLLFFIDKSGIIYISNKNEYQFKNIYNLIVKPLKKNNVTFNSFDNLINESQNEAVNIYMINNNPSVYYAQKLDIESWTILSFSVFNYLNNIRFNILILFFLIELIIFILSGFFIFLINKDFIENLIKSEKEFVDLFANAPIGVFLTHYDNKIPYLINKKAEEIFKLILNNHSEKSVISDYFTKESIMPHFDLKAKDHIIETFGVSLNNLSQNEYWIISKNIFFQKKQCRLFFIQDMIEILKVKKALIESQDRFKELADLMDEIIFETDLKGNLLFVNKKAFESFKYTPEEFSKGFNILDVVMEKDKLKSNLEKILKDLKIENSEYQMIQKDGSLFPAYVSSKVYYKDGKVTGIRGIVIDITKQKKIEEEMLKIGKVEAIGNLAGGIAHDFNNILAIIQNSVSLLEIDSNDQNNFKIFSDLKKTLNQAKKLSGQLLTFSKGDAPLKKFCDIKILVQETTSFVLSGSSILAEYDIEDNLLPVNLDEGQINQVLQNIIINSIHSMNKKGTIYIAIKNFITTDKMLYHKEFIKISIKDQGCGIDKEILPHIFEPFFTTKKNGKGLGLAIAERIIIKHEGWIDVESEINKGTTFNIYIPAQKDAVIKIENSENEIKKGSGRILFMDDEELLRNLAKKIINYLGYEAVLASGGKDAIKIFNDYKEKGKHFDCLILDLTIPGDIGGLEVLNEIKKNTPDIKAIVSSGYSEDPVIGNYKSYGFAGVVTKPYSIENLSNVLKRVIETN